MSFVLQAGEKLLFHQWSNRRSSHTTAGFGKLRITNQRVVFVPFLFGLKFRPIEIRIDDIQEIRAAPWIDYGKSVQNVTWNDHLYFRTKAGDEERFGLFGNNVVKVVRLIEAQMSHS